jgi:hypothetical protein
MAWEFVVEDGTGLANATSYCSLVYAAAYNTAHPYGSAWAALASDAIRERLLMLASRLLDHWCRWHGCRVKRVSEQGLEFPRYDVQDRDGNWLDSDAVPDFVQQATAELARHLSASDLTADPTKGIADLGVDVISLTFDPSDRRSVLPDSVKAIVRPYCRLAGGTLKRLRRC